MIPNIRMDKLLRIEMRRFGITNLPGMVRAMEQLPPDLVRREAENMGHILAGMVVDKINSQPGWWQPLNPQYLQSKIDEGLDERMLIATGAYIDSIGVQDVAATNTRTEVNVGVPSRLHPESKISFLQLARIHEYGTEKIPARPHWIPAFLEWRSRLPGMLQEMLGRLADDMHQRMAREGQSTTGVLTESRGAQVTTPPPSQTRPFWDIRGFGQSLWRSLIRRVQRRP